MCDFDAGVGGILMPVLFDAAGRPVEMEPADSELSLLIRQYIGWRMGSQRGSDQYANCQCGSGKRFKFCCRGRFVATLSGRSPTSKTP